VEQVEVNGVERVQGRLEAERPFVQSQEGMVAVAPESRRVFPHHPLGQSTHGIEASDNVLSHGLGRDAPVPQVAAYVDGQAGREGAPERGSGA
jgi:hypothetical protein